MSELRLQRKVTCPILPAIHLRREELIKRLDEATNNSISSEKGRATPYKLLMLHAPAGYGKTTLLIDFARHTSLPCCWYLLDQTDADRMTFLTTLLLSIRQHFPTFGGELDALLNGVSSEHANAPEEVGYFEVVLDALIAAIEREIPEPFLIALCNYQEINELREINGVISYLLQHLPAHCVLLLESRVIPDLDFAPLLANREIFGIGTSQLRFTTSEIRELAQTQGIEPLKDREIETLVSGFGGWITGILLGTRLNNMQQLQSTLSAEKLEEPVDPRYLFSYVVNEVFKSCQEVYTFLKEASVLQEMSPMMCASLLDVTPAQASAHLRYLEQEGLFVTHSGEGADIVYICTPVLRTLFYNELRKEEPDRFSALHQRAAKLLSAENNYSQAIYHALEASTYDIAAELITESAEQMINEGHAETLARWIDGFLPRRRGAVPDSCSFAPTFTSGWQIIRGHSRCLMLPKKLCRRLSTSQIF